MTPHAAARIPQPTQVDAIFRALSDPTRRNVIERLSRSPASVSELAKHHDMALPSFVAHLKVLETSGLVSSRKVGRVRTFRLESGPMKLAEDWLERQRTMWTRRLDRFDAYVLTLKEDTNE